MDKYTVDLDKVLNDFEYSELTDQYNTSTTSHVNNVHNPLSPKQDSCNKYKNTPTKHTITNVFQSLDEYLNTDIGVKNKPIINVTETSYNLANTQSDEVTEIPHSFSSVHSQKNDLFSEPAIDENIEQAHLNSTIIDISDVKLQSEDVRPFLESLPENLQAPINTTETSDNVLDAKTNDLKLDESTLSNLESIKNELSVTDLESNKTELVTDGVESTNNSEIPESETLTLHNVNANEYDNTNAQTKTIRVELSSHKNRTNTEGIVTTETIMSEESVVEMKNENLTKLDDTVSTEVPENLPEIEIPMVVGFDESIGMNDSELHQYLNELEDEYGNQNIDAIEKSDKAVENEDNKCEIESSNIDINICTEVINKEIDPTDEDKTLTSRPNTLKLNGQLQIDLIGEPGSTPYNNMYISKTLTAPKSPQESDTESSSSASPVFSDISSESNISTASTESVTDSMDKMRPKEVEADKPNKVLDKNVIPSTAYQEIPNSEDVPNNLDNNDNNVTAIVDNEEHLNDIPIATVSHEETCNEEVMDDQPAYNVQSNDSPIDEVASNSNQNEVSEQPISADNWLGKQAPLWIPDSEALNCLHCDTKFTVIKRRHHCRACGLVLCSKCCNLKYRLEYLEAEARVCLKCYDILNKDSNSSSGSEVSPSLGNSPNRQHSNQPNPNNPMEYCSMVPPLQQVSEVSQNPPTVMVPVGVLKRKGSSKSRTNKSVMFCDGIRPGSELTNLDNDFNYNESKSSHSKKGSPPPPKLNRNTPSVDPITKSFIPNNENGLPPQVTVFKSDISYSDCINNSNIVETLKNESLTFAVQSNLYVHVKIINMDCCINKWAWCFSTEGMITVGQDEIILLLEFIDNEKNIPKDLFLHLNSVYNDAQKGSSIAEYGISLHNTSSFLESKNHIGFLYIRSTFQCLQNVIIPKEPYLIGILIHRWEMPWAKIFPLRLILRLGAEYRYYPSPIISTRYRESVFVEIGHTIINLLADFRNFSYTLPNIRGLTIHMEEKNTTITIPSNRYEQVMKSLNNSSDHILAFGGNFSTKADSHLVCIQDTHGNNENTYTTHAINIHNRPRKVTGASFIVFNGALKSSSGLTAKSSIVEDGLMIQIPPEHMVQIRECLRNMKNHTIQCGCINATSDETVNIIWGENDANFNMGVQSPIDNQSLSGIPSIRVHNGKDYACNSGNRMIRWTEVFILQNGDGNIHEQDLDFSKLAESISKATCQALVKYLDLLSSNNFLKIGVRTTLHVENVSYSAGSNGMKLPPIYMKSLDNELIPVLHRITSNNLGENSIVLELMFRILNL